MKLVVIESPFRGKDEDQQRQFHAYARSCLLDSIIRGEAPFASHLLYSQILFDSIPEQRAQGMALGFWWMSRADLVAVYTDLGISIGMEIGIANAEFFKVPTEYRRIWRDHGLGSADGNGEPDGPPSDSP